ncbi:MAG: transglutaminase domain-containing protein [Thermoguttaceae bacterium]|nr:transglutaminase domain-containing protein [Thermoguttaceae bacterium]MDW8078096.1 transglutaminase domain-containing protein [Thermoguttaceae bacterium]
MSRSNSWRALKLRFFGHLAPLAFLALAITPFAGSAFAQFIQKTEGKGPQLGELTTQRWVAGVIVRATGGSCSGIRAYIPIPSDWPEQEVTTLEEDYSPGVKVTFRTVEETVRQMVVEIPYLAHGEEAKALITTEVRRRVILPPPDVSVFTLPDRRKLPRDVLPYLAVSPGIEVTNPKIQSLSRQLLASEGSAWQKVERIYDWVRENVKYQEGEFKGALAALTDKTGDCEEMTSLFIALCRAGGIPARTVWVPNHAYAEFYLVDDEGKGYWFPCQLAGERAFGHINEPRPILQKGDNFRSPTNPRDRKRYLAEQLTGTGGRPQVEFVRRLLAR